MIEEHVSLAADAGGRHPIRPLVLTVLLLAGFVGVLYGVTPVGARTG